MSLAALKMDRKLLFSRLSKIGNELFLGSYSRTFVLSKPHALKCFDNFTGPIVIASLTMRRVKGPETLFRLKM